jgi:hypothetical protein
MNESLIAVVIGGLIAIVAGIAGPIVQHVLTSKTNKENIRKDKLHSLILAIHECDAYMSKVRQARLYGSEVEPGLNPRAAVEALTAVNFPEVLDQFRVYMIASNNYEVWTLERAQERLSGKALDLTRWQEIIQDYTLGAANLIAAASGERTLTRDEAFTAPDKAQKGKPAPTS